MSDIDENEIAMLEEDIPDSLSKIINDNILREELGVGDGFTGPKGVLADYKFHQQQESARKQSEKEEFYDRISRGGMVSGWMQRQIDLDERTKFGNEYEFQPVERTVGRFGQFKEIDANDFVKHVEEEHHSTMVVVHVYRQHLPACREINRVITPITKKYPFTKFIRVNADKLGAAFDDVAFPMLLCYQKGELVGNFMRIIDDIRGWTINGTCESEDVEDFLLKKRILDENMIYDN